MSKYVKNTENLNRLLNWLDNGAPHVVFSLDMMYGSPERAEELLENQRGTLVDGDYTSSECGAVACIAGAAAAMLRGTFGHTADYYQDGFEWSEVQQDAVDFLGINRDAIPDGCDYMLDVFDPDIARALMGRPANSADAAQALRNLAEFGDPCWGDIA